MWWKCPEYETEGCSRGENFTGGKTSQRSEQAELSLTFKRIKKMMKKENLRGGGGSQTALDLGSGQLRGRKRSDIGKKKTRGATTA